MGKYIHQESIRIDMNFTNGAERNMSEQQYAKKYPILQLFSPLARVHGGEISIIANHPVDSGVRMDGMKLLFQNIPAPLVL